MDRPYLTTKQAAAALNLDPAYVRRLAKSHGFGWKPERDHLFTPAEVAAMRDRHDRRRRSTKKGAAMTTKLSPRERQIQAVAAHLADLGHIVEDRREIYSGPGDNECFDAAKIADINADGWTVETSAPLGGTIRHEGVVLTPTELDRAWTLAEQIQEEGGTWRP